MRTGETHSFNRKEWLNISKERKEKLKMANPTREEWLLKAEHDAMNAAAEAANTKAVQDYNIMMGNLEDPGEEEEEIDG